MNVSYDWYEPLRCQPLELTVNSEPPMIAAFCLF